VCTLPIHLEEVYTLDSHNTQIVEIEPKQGKNGTFWIAKLANGISATIFDFPIQVQAQENLNRPVTVVTETTQRGDRTYTNFISVTPSNGTAPPAQAPPIAQN
jgi:hypothetical protein